MCMATDFRLIHTRKKHNKSFKKSFVIVNPNMARSNCCFLQMDVDVRKLDVLTKSEVKFVSVELLIDLR